jgi:hypothetical protein
VSSFFRNLGAGSFGPVERVRRIADNIVNRKLLRGRPCCGNYGDPGC